MLSVNWIIRNCLAEEKGWKYILNSNLSLNSIKHVSHLLLDNFQAHFNLGEIAINIKLQLILSQKRLQKMLTNICCLIRWKTINISRTSTISILM